MIRCSVNNDREGLISLWHDSFGDNRKEIEFFLDNKYVPENTVVCEENGCIVSQLFLLEGEMHIGGDDYPSYYLYAACTAKEHRGKGIMGQMLEFTRNLASDRGVNFICLMPAEESLYNYYSKFGYKTSFGRKVIKSTLDVLKKVDLSRNNHSDFSVKTPEKSRDSAFYYIDYFKWDRQSVEFAFKFFEHYGGNVFQDCKGYILYTINDGCLCVKESTFTQNVLVEKIIKLCDKNKSDKFEIFLPAKIDFFEIAGEFKPNGMILCVNNKLDKDIKPDESGYLGLTLD